MVPMRNRSRNKLLHQLTSRVLIVIFAVVVVIGALVFGFQHAALDKSAYAFMDSLQNFYAEKMVLLDQEWQERVTRIHARIEVANYFSSPEDGWDKFQMALSLNDQVFSPMVLVLGKNHNVLFQLSSNNLKFQDGFDATNSSGWFLDPEKSHLFRWYQRPLWLGKQGKGKLVLFVAVDNATLFRNATPKTDLFLMYDQRIVASSHGQVNVRPESIGIRHYWRGGFRYDQVTLNWGNGNERPPLLLIRHQSAPLFSVWEILGVGVLIFMAITLLFWLTLGSWAVRLAHRIGTLGLISEEFSNTCAISQTMREHFRLTQGSVWDEISDVATSMENLTETVVNRNQDLEKQARELKESEENTQALMHSLRDTVLVFDARGNIHFCNQVGETMFGLPRHELLKRPVASLFVDKKSKSSTRKNHLAFLNYDPNSARTGILEGTAKGADGKEIPVSISLSHWTRNHTNYFTVIVRDISEHKLLEARDLRAYVNRVAISALLEIGIEALTLHRKLEVALEIILTVPWVAVQYKGSIFLTTDSDELEMVVHKGLNNFLLNACRRIPFGFCMCGKAALSRQIEFSSCLDARHDVTFEGIHEHGHYCVPILLRDRLLGVLNLYVDHHHQHDPEEEAFLTTIANTLAGLIERGQVEDRIQHMASHDALTGLPNRMLFRELLEQEIRHASRHQKRLATGFFDLDHFKAVNDTLGHEAGDLLLKAVASRVKEQLRDSDTLARLGGDEFTLILPAIGDVDSVLLVANKIILALSAPFDIQGKPCHIGVSIGVSLFPDHGQTVDALLQKADHAMYIVKKSGRNNIVIYDPSMEP
ncbi:MAG: diguanylate cyclase [Magnetococcus sp. DMHC-1]